MKIWIITLVGVCLSISSFCQTMKYSQFNNTPVLTNPALITMQESATVHIQYRKLNLQHGQGLSLPFLSAISPLRYKKQSQFGAYSISIIQQRAGTNGILVTTGFNGGFAYKIRINNNNIISAGIQGAYYNLRVDQSRITTDNQYQNGYDPGLPIGENISSFSSNAFQVNTGLNWVTTTRENRVKSWLGAGLYNLNRPSVAFIQENSKEGRLPFSVSVNAGYNVENLFQNRATITPTLRFIQENKISLLNVGMEGKIGVSSVEENKVLLGTFYSTNGSLMVYSGVQIGKIYVSIGYDQIVTNTQKARTTLSAIETGIRYKF